MSAENFQRLRGRAALALWTIVSRPAVCLPILVMMAEAVISRKVTRFVLKFRRWVRRRVRGGQSPAESCRVRAGEPSLLHDDKLSRVSTIRIPAPEPGREDTVFFWTSLDVNEVDSEAPDEGGSRSGQDSSHKGWIQ